MGSDDLRLALVLVALEPAIGGVLLTGEKGSGKTTAARGLAAVLPGAAPFVELPLGASEDRVVGSLDLRAALGGGDYRFQPGLLARADGGVLYVDEVNLLADHLVDVLLDAAATGVHRVERDGASHEHPARFVLVGSMNPEEGELRPQLLDRFGLSVSVAAPTDPADRAEAVARRLDYDADPAAFGARFADEEDALRRRLSATRPRPLPPGLAQEVGRRCAQAGAEGLRADLVICRAAGALAGWEGADRVTEEHVERVAPLALAHRRRSPLDPPPRGAPGPAPSGGPGATAPPGGPPPASGEGGGPGHNGGGTAPEAPPAPPETGAPPPLARPEVRAAPGPGTAGRRAGSGGPDPDRGRSVGARVPDTSAPLRSLAPRATVTAALERRAAGGEGPGPLTLVAGDLREPVRVGPQAALVVLAVDTSGSMGAAERAAGARQAARGLLVDAYQRRDRVGVVTFRGTGAEVVLRPTSSTEVAAARLASLPTGGRTPLGEGLRAAGELLAAGQRRGLRPVLVVVSDGRATWAPDGRDPVEDALDAARTLARRGVSALVVDCEGPRAGLGLAENLAQALEARRVTPAGAGGAELAGSVAAGLRGLAPGPGGSR